MDSDAASSGPYLIWASTVPGFEAIAAKEVSELLSVKSDGIAQSRGRLFFHVSEAAVSRLMLLRTVDRLYVVMSDLRDQDGLQVADKDAALAELPPMVGQCNWAAGLSVWRECWRPAFTGPSVSHLPQKLPPPSERDPTLPAFRCSCVRTGKHHSFTSKDAAAVFGTTVQDFFGWNVNMTCYDLDVVLLMEETTLRICLTLNRASLHFRNLHYYGPTTLRPTIAASMLRACSPQPYEVVCDPLSGSGSIPLEAAVSMPYCFHLAGDIHPKAVENTGLNLKDYNKNEDEVVGRKRALLELVRWDATNLPLKDAAIDVFVLDLPFGKRMGSKANNKQLYPALLNELARVTRPGTGRVCLLTQDRRSLTLAYQQTKCWWRLRRLFNLNTGGLATVVWLCSRTPRQWSEGRTNSSVQEGPADSVSL